VDLRFDIQETFDLTWFASLRCFTPNNRPLSFIVA